MKTLKIGTDCSGIEAPIQALKQMKIKFSHEFASDIDENCRKSIEANYKPKILYSDMTKRDNNKLPNIYMWISLSAF